MNFKKIKRLFKRKKKRSRKEEKEKRRGFIPIPCNTCCCVGVVLLLLVGMFAFGSGGNFIAEWFNGGTTTTQTTTTTTTTPTIPTTTTTHPTYPVDDYYYQIGVEFIRGGAEDYFDSEMEVKLYQDDFMTWIEDFELYPYGVQVSDYDYKPNDQFFVDGYCGDEDNNIAFYGIITSNVPITLNILWNGEWYGDYVSVTWIADGSGVRWDYP